LLCSLFHSPDTLSLLVPNIFLNTLFSNTLSVCSSLKVNDQVSHLYKTTGKVIVLYILFPLFVDSKLEDKIFCTECWKAFPAFSMFYWCTITHIMYLNLCCFFQQHKCKTLFPPQYVLLSADQMFPDRSPQTPVCIFCLS